MKHKKIVVCDVCDTLFYSNTTFDFIRFVTSKQKKYKSLLFKILNSRWSPLFYIIIILSKLISLDLAKRWSLLLLKGLTVNESMLLANEFYVDFLSKRKIAPVFELIDKIREGNDFILVSSSIDIVVRVVAEKNSMSFIASQLEIKDKKLTGNLLTELYSKKHIDILPYLTKGDLMVITDNQSDWQLLSMASSRIVVVANEADKIFWKSLNPRFIIK